GQCENPLSCADTGDVSPLTGSLRYELPADVAPASPYGVPLAFHRFYMSQYVPGASPANYKVQLGDRWGHSYASWLTKDTVPNPDQIILHLPRGQEALFKFTTTSGGFDNYN